MTSEPRSIKRHLSSVSFLELPIISIFFSWQKSFICLSSPSIWVLLVTVVITKKSVQLLTPRRSITETSCPLCSCRSLPIKLALSASVTDDISSIKIPSKKQSDISFIINAVNHHFVHIFVKYFFASDIFTANKIRKCVNHFVVP